jgi:hypothetical protein
MSKNQENAQLAEVAPVSRTYHYQYHVSLVEFNGQCRIYYSTNSPLLCRGTMNLITTNGPRIVAFSSVKAEGGYFDTGKSWGAGWYAQWNDTDANGDPVVIAKSGVTGE